MTLVDRVPAASPPITSSAVGINGASISTGNVSGAAAAAAANRKPPARSQDKPPVSAHLEGGLAKSKPSSDRGVVKSNGQAPSSLPPNTAADLLERLGAKKDCASDGVKSVADDVIKGSSKSIGSGGASGDSTGMRLSVTQGQAAGIKDKKGKEISLEANHTEKVSIGDADGGEGGSAMAPPAAPVADAGVGNETSTEDSSATRAEAAVSGGAPAPVAAVKSSSMLMSNSVSHSASNAPMPSSLASGGVALLKSPESKGVPSPQSQVVTVATVMVGNGKRDNGTGGNDHGKGGGGDKKEGLPSGSGGGGGGGPVPVTSGITTTTSSSKRREKKRRRLERAAAAAAVAATAGAAASSPNGSVSTGDVTKEDISSTASLSSGTSPQGGTGKSSSDIVGIGLSAAAAAAATEVASPPVVSPSAKARPSEGVSSDEDTKKGDGNVGELAAGSGQSEVQRNAEASEGQTAVADSGEKKKAKKKGKRSKKKSNGVQADTLDGEASHTGVAVGAASNRDGDGKVTSPPEIPAVESRPQEPTHEGSTLKGKRTRESSEARSVQVDEGNVADEPADAPTSKKRKKRKKRQDEAMAAANAAVEAAGIALGLTQPSTTLRDSSDGLREGLSGATAGGRGGGWAEVFSRVVQGGASGGASVSSGEALAAGDGSGFGNFAGMEVGRAGFFVPHC